MNKKFRQNTFAVMIIFISIMGFNAVTPAMNTFMTIWGGKVSESTIYMIYSLPLLIMCPVTVICGKIAGKQVPFRTLAVIGNLLYVIGGCAPAFFTKSFTLILFFRVVFGVGLGILTPLGNALIMASYEEKKSNHLIGIGTLIMNAGAIILQQVGGIFCGLQWNLTFLSYMTGIIPLVMSFFIKEPLPVDSAETSEKEHSVPAGVWIMGLSILIVNTANIAIMMNVSVMMASKGIASPSQAAMVLSLNTVGGCIAGWLFGYFYEKLKRFLMPTALICSIIGQALLLSGQGVAVISAGSFLNGLGFSLFHTAVYSMVGSIVSAEEKTFSISLVMTFLNISGFLGSWFLALVNLLFGESLHHSYYVSFVIFGAAAVFYILYNPLRGYGVKSAKL